MKLCTFSLHYPGSLRVHSISFGLGSLLNSPEININLLISSDRLRCKITISSANAHIYRVLKLLTGHLIFAESQVVTNIEPLSRFKSSFQCHSAYRMIQFQFHGLT